MVKKLVSTLLAVILSAGMTMGAFASALSPSTPGRVTQVTVSRTITTYVSISGQTSEEGDYLNVAAVTQQTYSLIKTQYDQQIAQLEEAAAQNTQNTSTQSSQAAATEAGNSLAVTTAALNAIGEAFQKQQEEPDQTTTLATVMSAALSVIGNGSATVEFESRLSVVQNFEQTSTTDTDETTGTTNTTKAAAYEKYESYTHIRVDTTRINFADAQVFFTTLNNVRRGRRAALQQKPPVTSEAQTEAVTEEVNVDAEDEEEGIGDDVKLASGQDYVYYVDIDLPVDTEDEEALDNYLETRAAFIYDDDLEAYVPILLKDIYNKEDKTIELTNLGIWYIADVSNALVVEDAAS